MKIALGTSETTSSILTFSLEGAQKGKRERKGQKAYLKR